METVGITGPADVEAALLHELLDPPPAPDSLRPGPTADLRNAMARFSGVGSHTAPRASVESVLFALRSHVFAADARRRTASILEAAVSPQTLDVETDVAFVVPVETVASALGVADRDLVAVRSDVREIVEVIGRLEPASPESDAAVIRLSSRLEALGHDAVAAISLLYQAHDASAALFLSVLSTEQTGQRRRPAIASTKRTATEAVSIGAHHLEQGMTATIDLDSSSFEFGVGAHACPGREIAERIVAGMVDAVRSDGR